VLGLYGGDVRHGGEDVGTVHGRALQAVAVVNLPLARLLVDVKLQQQQQQQHMHARTHQENQVMDRALGSGGGWVIQVC